MSFSTAQKPNLKRCLVSDMAFVLSLMASHEGRTPNEVLRSAVTEYAGRDEAPRLRAILSVLIAGLQEDAFGHREDSDRTLITVCAACERRWPCIFAEHGEMANLAEARLRELDEPPQSANEHINLGGAGGPA